MIPLAQASLLVLPREVKGEEGKDASSQSDKCEVRCMSLDKMRFIASGVEEGRYNSGGVPKHDLCPRCGSAFAISWVVCIEPGDVDSKHNIDSSSNDEASKVEDTRWSTRQQYRIPSSADAAHSRRDRPAYLLPVANPGKRKIDDSTDGIARHGNCFPSVRCIIDISFEHLRS